MNEKSFLYDSILLAAGLFIVALTYGCASSSRTESSYSSTPPPAPPAATVAATDAANQREHVIGVWDGTTLASCNPMLPFQSRCNAQQKVTITLVEDKSSKLGGYYKCAYGNMNCYNLNETGKVVDATLNGSRVSMRVIMRDGTTCRFSGLDKGGDINGGYSCYSGGSLLEQGSWRARRSY
jgi:hypothetical protein